jgi:predicted transposase/invertase (TIGR01784 family)
MTYGQQLRKEGAQQGMQQGMQQGRQARNFEIAKSMLRKGFSLGVVTELTSLSRAELEKLNKADNY